MVSWFAYATLPPRRVPIAGSAARGAIPRAAGALTPVEEVPLSQKRFLKSV